MIQRLQNWWRDWRDPRHDYVVSVDTGVAIMSEQHENKTHAEVWREVLRWRWIVRTMGLDWVVEYRKRCDND